MSEKELNDKKEEKGLFPETYLNAEQISLISLITVNGEDAYKIKISGENEAVRYYDAKTSLLVRTEKTEEAQGQKMTSTTDISDYRMVDDIMMPFTKLITAGPQLITFSASEIKINEGVSKKDFK